MDILSDILSHLQLAGTLYFRTSFTSPWSIKVPAFEDVMRFHYAHHGRCHVRINNAPDPVLLEQGDLLIIMHGAPHTLYCDPTTEDQAVLLDKVVEESGFTGNGTLVYGDYGTHHETQLVCGHFTFDSDANHLLIDAFPSHIHIQNYGSASGSWMEHTLKVIGNEAGRGDVGGDLIALKLSEIIFAQAIRTFINNQQEPVPVLSGFTDPGIARSLSAIHQNPSGSWTLQSLAEIAGMSRTAFANHFARIMTVTPLNYITHWRMQIARHQLTKTDESIISIAEAVGYRSEAAFGRVFKKHFHQPPASYRRTARAS